MYKLQRSCNSLWWYCEECKEMPITTVLKEAIEVQINAEYFNMPLSLGDLSHTVYFNNHTRLCLVSERSKDAWSKH